MKPSLLNRKVHYWISGFIALPLLVIAVTGVILQCKEGVAWVEPFEQEGGAKEPAVPFERVLDICKSVPKAGIASWADVNRYELRPNIGLIKVISNTDWEIQLDAKTGDVLQVAYRRSDWIRQIHEGEYFYDGIKFGVFLPAGIGLILLTLTGLYLFWQPIGVKWRRRKK